MFKNAIKSLTPRHYKILDLAIAGITNAQISRNLGITQVQVSLIISSPSFQHQFAIRRSQTVEKQAEKASNDIDDVKNVLTRGAKIAADKLISGLSSNNEGIKLKSAIEILDRTGYPKEQKLSGGITAATQIIINADSLKTLQESLILDAQIVKTETENIDSKENKDEAGTFDYGQLS